MQETPGIGGSGSKVPMGPNPQTEIIQNVPKTLSCYTSYVGAFSDQTARAYNVGITTTDQDLGSNNSHHFFDNRGD